MTRNSAHLLRWGLAGCCLALGLGDHAAAKGQDAAAPLRSARGGVASATSVHVRARGSITLTAPPGSASAVQSRSGWAELEYWESGPRYRCRVRTDPALGLASDYEAAWDGGRFRAWDPKSEVLVVANHEIRQDVPFALPNPLFTYFDYLTFSPNECRLCLFRLKDLRDERALQRFSMIRPAEEGDPGLRFPGWRLTTDPESPVFQHRVLPAAEFPDTRVGRIERVATTGQVLAAFDFSTYQAFHLPAGDVMLPREVRMASYYPGSASPASESTFTMDILEFDVPLVVGVFVLDEAGAARIWDEDEKRFIRDTPCKACKRPDTKR